MPEQIGTLQEVFSTIQVTEKFSKREFILKIASTTAKYDENVKFELINDKVDTIDAYGVGDKIRVYYNLKGKEAKGKYYNSIQAWKLERM